jgi:hypothetical protein
MTPYDGFCRLLNMPAAAFHPLGKNGVCRLRRRSGGEKHRVKPLNPAYSTLKFRGERRERLVRFLGNVEKVVQDVTRKQVGLAGMQKRSA